MDSSSSVDFECTETAGGVSAITLSTTNENGASWNKFLEKTQRLQLSSSSNRSTDSLECMTDEECNISNSAQSYSTTPSTNESSAMNSDFDSQSDKTSDRYSSTEHLVTHDLVTSSMYLSAFESQPEERDNNEYINTLYNKSSSSSDEERNMESSFGFFDRDDSARSDNWGWFDADIEDSSSIEYKNLRASWLKVTGSRCYTSSKGELQGKKSAEDPGVLFRWNNPNPSMSIKNSTSNFAMSSGHIGNSNADLQLSCCISGYRKRQLSECGTICAEFHLIFCYGSLSFNSWKRFSEFQKLYEIVKHFHDDETSSRQFPVTIIDWEALKRRQKWFRDLRTPYLIEKSVYLGRFIQSLLLESDGPGLLLLFSRCEELSI